MTKRVSDPDIAEVIDLRDVDVRDRAFATDANPVIFPDVSLDDLRALLDEPLHRDDEICRAVLALAEAGVAPEPVGDPHVDQWFAFVGAVARLGEPSTYVGMFKVRVEEACAVARALPTPEQTTAAHVILDRTAAKAANAREFRHGLLAARSLDPQVLAPRSVVDAVLRPCLDHATEARGEKVVSYGLSTALAVLASGDGACISTDDVWALSAACQGMPDGLRAPLKEQANKLVGQDRRLVLPLLDPHHRRGRRWRRRFSTR